jgi:hypothetical protein
MMIQRLNNRIPFGYPAELIAYNVAYEAFVENISEKGMGMKIYHLSAENNFNYVSDIILKIHLIYPLLGEKIYLDCRKKWSSKNSTKSVIENIGVEIINPPKEYNELHEVYQ